MVNRMAADGIPVTLEAVRARGRRGCDGRSPAHRRRTRDRRGRRAPRRGLRALARQRQPLLRRATTPPTRCAPSRWCAPPGECPSSRTRGPAPGVGWSLTRSWRSWPRPAWPGSRCTTATTTRMPCCTSAISRGPLGLLVTGSSDYHGEGKQNRLGEFTTAPDVLEAIEDHGDGQRRWPVPEPERAGTRPRGRRSGGPVPDDATDTPCRERPHPVVPRPARDRRHGDRTALRARGQHRGEPAVRRRPHRPVLHADPLLRRARRTRHRAVARALRSGGDGIRHGVGDPRRRDAIPHPGHGEPVRPLPQRPALPLALRRAQHGRPCRRLEPPRPRAARALLRHPVPPRAGHAAHQAARPRHSCARSSPSTTSTSSCSPATCRCCPTT